MFADRRQAGRRLAGRVRALDALRGGNVVVAALPRGGVPVAFEVADALGAELDVLVVRKLGVPFQPELAMGAVGEEGVTVVNDDVVRICGISASELDAKAETERAAVARRAVGYRRGHPRVPLSGRTVVVVDDGVATGATARAACRVARAHGAARVVVAVPVVAADVVEDLRADADDVVWLDAPRHLMGVGAWYADFSQTADDEVVSLLHTAATRRARTPDTRTRDTGTPDTRTRDARTPDTRTGDTRTRDTGTTGVRGTGRPRAEDVRFLGGGVPLAGRLNVPEDARGLVVFVHGSGSSRHSPRNRSVADGLNRAGFGTLLFDLLTPEEGDDRSRVFDIGLLADRLHDVTVQVRERVADAVAWVGYFGASTGAAAALWAAAEPDARIAAVVSRGGRPDLAGSRLGAVDAPTLLIVGGRDDTVLDLNRRARNRLRGPSRLDVIPGATHLFAEPGALVQVTDLACAWFARWGAPR